MKHATLVNVGLFQATWFACVLGGPFWGAAGLGLMFGFSWRAQSLAVDATSAGIAAVIGLCLDTLWIQAGVLDFFDSAVAPLWIIMLWVGVGLSVNHGLAYFKDRALLGGLLAGVAAPICYLSGESLGAVGVPNVALLGVVAVTWFVVFWLGFSVSGVRRMGLSDVDI